MATALAPLTPHMDLYWDFHIDADDPVSDPVTAFAFIASVSRVFASVSSTTGTPPMGGAVLEENGRRHDVQRALGRARNSNRLHCLGDIVRVDTAANGVQVAGLSDNGWDQGQLFLTQNMSYLSPAGMAQVLLSASSAGGANQVVVAVEAAGLAGAPQLDVIALRDQAGSQIVIRAVNFAPFPTTADVVLQGCTLTGSSAALTALSGALEAQNLPSNPLNIAPVSSNVAAQPGSGGMGANVSVTLQPYSFTTINVPCKSSGGAGEASTFAADVSTPATTCDLPSDNSSVVKTISYQLGRPPMGHLQQQCMGCAAGWGPRRRWLHRSVLQHLLVL